MRRPARGDVFELTIEGRKRYIQVTHIHPQFGTLIRVIRGDWKSPPDLETVRNGESEYVSFVKLGREAFANGIKYFGTAPIPCDSEIFPIFRTGLSNPKDKKVHVWWLWDGTKSWKIGALTHEQRNLPIRGIWDHDMLFTRLKEEWSPSVDRR